MGPYNSRTKHMTIANTNAFTGPRNQPRVIIKRGVQQVAIRFNAALVKVAKLNRFTHLVPKVSTASDIVEFEFSTSQYIGDVRAYKLQHYGGNQRRRTPSSARVTYVTASRFPELTKGGFLPSVSSVGGRLVVRIFLETRASLDETEPPEVERLPLQKEHDTLETIVDQIQHRWRATQIWLYGSRACGRHREGSDWDLFAVVPDDTPIHVVDDPMSTWNMRVIAGARTDIRLCRKMDFTDYRDVPNTLAFEVSHTGRIVG